MGGSGTGQALLSRWASTRTGSRAPFGFRIRWSVRSEASQPRASADLMAGKRLFALRVPSFHESITVPRISVAASSGSDGDSVDGFKGPDLGPPWGVDLTPPPSGCGTAPVLYWDWGSRIGTGWKMLCSRVIQVIAG